MKKKILVIDDDHDIVRGTQMRLSNAGYEIEAAYDGVEGGEAVANNRPDAIVLDVRMPKKNGMELLRELKLDEGNRSIPVIMLSASLGDQKMALDAGASFFLRKPYQGKHLIAAVSASLKPKSSRTLGES